MALVAAVAARQGLNPRPCHVGQGHGYEGPGQLACEYPVQAAHRHEVAVDAEADDDARGAYGDEGATTEFLAFVHVGDVTLNQR